MKTNKTPKVLKNTRTESIRKSDAFFNTLEDNINMEIIRSNSKPKLVDGGTLIDYNGLLYIVNHVGPDGILCDDLETFFAWDKF